MGALRELCEDYKEQILISKKGNTTNRVGIGPMISISVDDYNELN